jgi:hypothetical protein
MDIEIYLGLISVLFVYYYTDTTQILHRNYTETKFETLLFLSGILLYQSMDLFIIHNGIRNKFLG